MGNDLVIRKGSLILGPTPSTGSITTEAIFFTATPKTGSTATDRFLVLDNNNIVKQVPSSSVIIDLNVSNGPQTAGRTTLLSAPSSDTIFAKSISFTGSNGIVVIENIGAQTLDYVIDGSALVTFSSGLYSQRPSSALVGQEYYQTDILEGKYMWDGLTWKLMPDGNTEIYSKYLANTYPMNGNVSGTGSAHYQDGSVGFSIWRMDTGTTSTGIAQIRTSQNMILGGATGKYIMNHAGVFLTTLSTSGERYNVRIGRPAGADGIGLFFKYTDNVNSGRWQCIAHNGSTSVTISAGTGPTASIAQEFTIVYDQSGVDTAKFYINNTLVANISGSLPANFTNGYAGSISIEKVVGSTNRSLFVDDTVIKRIL